MAHKINSLVASMLIAAAAVGASAAPSAAGQFSINLSPKQAEQQRMMDAGLGIYALVKGIEDGSITQRGNRNAAGIAQSEGDSLGIIYQEGNRHTGTISQQGGRNSYGLFQFGEGTESHVRQSGNESGLGFIFGW